MPVRLEPEAPRSRVKHSTTEPLRSLSLICDCGISWSYSLVLYRGSYRSAHVLLNLLNKLKKSYKMRGLQSILSLFRNLNARLAEHFIACCEKAIKCSASLAFYSFRISWLSSTCLINSIIQVHNFSSIYHNYKNYLKSHFWHENIKILPSFTQHYNGHHYVT